MTSRLNLYKFNEIYDKTYLDLLKYVVIKCHNINDTNDIMQEIYLEFWKILSKKEVSDINIKSYLIGIANNKIKKYYTFLQKVKIISLFETNDKDQELIETLEDGMNINEIIIQADNWDTIWKYIKSKKNQDIPKVFYLYYKLELSIKEISKELQRSESYIKHLIYRTLKELQDNFGNGGK
ncbi:MAG: RNA polymerase sigma factor [Mycoplasmatota bacterium]|nr:RNA polymerase sigma factor [Mycoplasmatota bacterium]